MNEDLTLARRIAAAPSLADAEAAHARVEGWIAELAATPAGETLKRVLADHPIVGALLAGVVEGSPHLWDMARSDPERLAAILQCDPDSRFDAILSNATRAIAAASEEAEVMRLLRRMKAEAALLTALADIGGV